MRAIDVYKTRVIELIDEAKLDGLEIGTYEIKIEGYEKGIEYGITISDGKDMIKVPVYKDNSVEVLE